MKMRNSLALASLILFGLTLAQAQADGLILDGVGPISGGRGGTNQGFSDNAAIILDNPAGMMNVAGEGLAELGIDTVTPVVNYSDPYNDVQSKVRPLPLPNLGYIRKSANGQWAWGIGAFVPAGFGASYGVMNEPNTGANLLRSQGGMAKLLPALSFRATERLSLGIAVGIGFSYASFEGPLYLQSPPLAGVPAILDMEGTGVAPVGSVGMQYKLTEKTTIGATYTEQSNFWLHGSTNATLLPGFLIESRFNSKFKLKWPRSVAVGIKHDICPHRRVSADVIWYDWAHAFNNIELAFYDASNPFLPGQVNQTLPLNWTNSVSMRLGYETDVTDVDTFRFGYVYHSSPSPDSTLNPYLDGILEHGFSLGYSRKFSRATLNAGYQYYFGDTRHVDTSGLIGGQFNDSTMKAEAHIAMLSLLVPF